MDASSPMMQQMSVGAPQQQQQDDSAGDLLNQDEHQAWYLRDADDVVTALLEKREEYYNAMRANGMVSMWRRNWAQYFGTDADRPGDFSAHHISRVGEEREYTRVRINEFRSFIRQQIQTALGPQPAYKATTKSTDFATLAGIDSVDRAVQSVMDKMWTQRKRRRLLERAVVLGMGFGHERWDQSGGDDTQEEKPVIDPQTGKQAEQPMLDPETKQPIVGAMGVPVTEPAVEKIDVKTGMPTVDIGSPWEMYYDPQEEEELSWVVVSEQRSKWELAKMFPEHAQELISLAGGDDEFTREKLFGANIFTQLSSNEDKVTLQHFYLPRCTEAEDGRYIGFVEGCEFLWDRPMPIQTSGLFPVVVCMPAAFIGAYVGYADASDMVPVQELIDNVTSDWASNVRAFGRLTLMNPKGSAMNLEAIRKGMRAVDYTGEKTPSYLVPPEMGHGEALLDYAHRRMESVTQQNAVRRGDPQANIKSGTMAALFNQQSIEFVSDMQQAFDESERQIANIALEMLSKRAKGEFLIKVAGEGSRPYWETFAAQGFKGIQDIHIETLSPMMRSPAGRYQTWEVIQTTPPDKIAAVIRGLDKGDWSGLMEDEIAGDMRLVSESEHLLKGEYVRVNSLDDHAAHIKRHFADYEKLEAAEPSLANPDAMDPQTGEMQPLQTTGKYEPAKKALLWHITQHRSQWQYVDPGTATLLNRPLPPPIPGTPTGDLMMMTGAAGAPPGAGGQAPDQQGAQSGKPPSGAGLPTQAGNTPDAGAQPQQPSPAQPAQPPQG